MKKLFPISVIVLVLIIAWVFVRFVIGGPEDDWICVDGEWVKHGVPAAPKPTTGCGDELVDCQSYDLENCPEQCVVCPPCIECSSLSCQTKALCQKLGIGRDWYEEIKKRISNFEDCAAAGNPVMESYPRQCRANNQTFVEDIGNELEKTDLIRIDNPRPNQTVSSPLEITGQARGYWFFEANFPIKLLDTNDNVIATAIAQAQGEWMTEDFVPFEAELTFDLPTKEKGTLILEKDNPSDLPENADELRVPVNFSQTETITVKVFFNNDNLDPEFSCNKVFPVERLIVKTQAVGQAALEELLKGTTNQEKEDGFFTSINSGVKIQKLVIENGVAGVDFDEQLEYQVGGSCRVAAIRAQITQTLKQFSTISEVIISINDRTEDILQP